MNQPVQIVRYAELVPCRTAFIDAHTPGSDQNFTIIGGGVSKLLTSMSILKIAPGFNIGATGQPLNAEIRFIHTERQKSFFSVAVFLGTLG